MYIRSSRSNPQLYVPDARETLGKTTAIITNPISQMVSPWNKPSDKAYQRDEYDGGILGLTPQYSIKKDGVTSVQSPKDIMDFGKYAVNYFMMYQKAVYYFYNCSILASVIKRVVEETLRNDIELVPTFAVKCPECLTEFPGKIKKCKSCGYQGDFITPDYKQKRLLRNWEGGDIEDKINKNGQSLFDLTKDFLYNALVFGHPLVLCRSLYTHNPYGEIIDEVPLEFMTLTPMRAFLVFDERGVPGRDYGFTLFDRETQFKLDKEYNKEMGPGFTEEGHKIYTTHWIISPTEGGPREQGEQYSNKEVYSHPFGIPSRYYGIPNCIPIQLDIHAWMALSARVTKYYNVGHPQGVFVINSTNTDNLDSIMQTLKLKMAGDPFAIPVMALPPANQGGRAQWIPFADNPTGDMMAVKSELLQRISAQFGMNGLFLGDTHALKGNSNEQQQAAVLDRNLMGVRHYVNHFLKWLTRKYVGVTDWVYKVGEPPDDSEAKKLDLALKHAELRLKHRELGFGVIGLDEDYNIDMTATPQAGGIEGTSLLGMMGENTDPFKEKSANFGESSFTAKQASGKPGMSGNPVL